MTAAATPSKGTSSKGAKPGGASAEVKGVKKKKSCSNSNAASGKNGYNELEALRCQNDQYEREMEELRKILGKDFLPSELETFRPRDAEDHEAVSEDAKNHERENVNAHLRHGSISFHSFVDSDERTAGPGAGGLDDAGDAGGVGSVGSQPARPLSGFFADASSQGAVRLEMILDSTTDMHRTFHLDIQTHPHRHSLTLPPTPTPTHVLRTGRRPGDEAQREAAKAHAAGDRVQRAVYIGTRALDGAYPRGGAGKEAAGQGFRARDLEVSPESDGDGVQQGPVVVLQWRQVR